MMSPSDVMACAYPSYSDSIRSITGEMIPIPCGKCFCCRLDLQKQATDRMFCAYHSHNCSAFVTFTYDDEHLKFQDGFKNATLSKDDLHKYLDKIRHLIKVPFEYYACGEYGDNFNRPHYHALFFGLDYLLHKKFFEDSWKLGSVKVLPCTPKAFRYVAKYLTKSSNSDSEYYDYGLIPPFRKMSRGLGLSVYLDHVDELALTGFFVFKSRKINVNRYYFNRLVHYNPVFRERYERNIDDYKRQLSAEAASFNLPTDLYVRTKIENLESNLSSRSVRTSSHL